MKGDKAYFPISDEQDRKTCSRMDGALWERILRFDEWLQENRIVALEAQVAELRREVDSLRASR